MTFQLSIKTDNAAFYDDDDEEQTEAGPACYAELARILRHLADELDNGAETEGRLGDINGNTVGRWSLA